MPEDTNNTRPDEALLEQFLGAVVEHATFDGWSDKAVAKARKDLDLSPDYPDGLPSNGLNALREWSFHLDRRMAASVSSDLPAAERVRDKIVLCVRRRLELLAPHHEPARRAAVVLALPPNAFLSMRCLHNTVDTIWYAAGDRATDYNYYTKRGLLASVYIATLVHWLSDTSTDHVATWAFLDRRIDDVMKIPGNLSALRHRLASLPNPLDFVRKMRRAQHWTYRY